MESVTFETYVVVVGQERMGIRALISGLIPRVSMNLKVSKEKIANNT